MEIESTVFEESRSGLHVDNVKAMANFGKAELAAVGGENILGA
jgi:hypothetical protein